MEVDKITLRSRKTLYICSFYMPKRNMTVIDNLQKSVENLKGNKPKDFNFTGINWESFTVNSNDDHDRAIQQK